MNEEGFDDLLDGVRNRIDEIESLHRTRELTVRFEFYLYVVSVILIQNFSSKISAGAILLD